MSLTFNKTTGNFFPQALITILFMSLLITQVKPSAGEIVANSGNEAPQTKAASEAKSDSYLSEILKDNSIQARVNFILNVNKSQESSIDYFVSSFVHDALKQNIRSFPIKSKDEISDPKTSKPPKILVPKDLTKEKAVIGDITELIPLPEKEKDNDGIERITKSVEPNSIIWLPHPYLVAGSFHLETYPHDTSCAVWSLLELVKSRAINEEKRNEIIQIAKSQLENFNFQVQTFGFPLNGNRGYFITRSQSNVIPTNVLQYYLVTKDTNWLKNIGLPLSEAIFNYWTSKGAEVKTPGGTGYRWIAHGKGPCKEVVESHDLHNFYYFNVLKVLTDYSQMPDLERPSFAMGFEYKEVIETFSINDALRDKLEEASMIGEEVTGYYLEDEPLIKYMGAYFRLTHEYYLNDRRSRVSGYDTNHLYGPFNSFTYDFIPVDHNLLLYKGAKDIAEMALAINDKEKAKHYLKKAGELKKMIIKTHFDENKGMFFDHNAKTKTLRTNYPFLSAGYAFFTEIFDTSKKEEKEMLLRMVKFIEENLEGSEGLYASGIETGLHWDSPYVWPVQQVYIVSGLRNYAKNLQDLQEYEASKHLTEVADRISVKFLLANYADWLRSKGKLIGEKVVRQESLLTGYASGNNYTWNLTAVMYLYETLSEKGKEFLHSLVQAPVGNKVL